MHTILLPVDGSEHAMSAVRHAITNIKEGLVADIHVIHVQPIMVMLGEPMLYDYAQIEDAQRLQGESVLKEACKPLDEAGLKYTTHFEIGPVSNTIVDYAKAHGCDIIIMGTRGMGVFGNLVLGSTANEVVHLAEIPVTLVK